MINRRLKEGTREYNKIKSLKVAFVVDECHRAVTPQTKRDIEKFFSNSIWFGFTGTPIFEENKYEQKVICHRLQRNYMVRAFIVTL